MRLNHQLDVVVEEVDVMVAVEEEVDAMVVVGVEEEMEEEVDVE